MKPIFASNGSPVGDGTRITRVSGGGTVFEVMTDEKTGKFSPIRFAGVSTTQPIATPPVITTPTVPISTEYPAIPQGVRKPGDIPLMKSDWSSGELVLTTWVGGSGTLGNPALIDWKDGAATLNARRINNVWNSGVMQLNRPRKASGLWQAVLDCTIPEAVCAFFTYGSKNELDWELVKRPDGKLYWALNVHMPKIGGGRTHLNESGQKGPLIPFKTGVHVYGFNLSSTDCKFFMDGNLVATIRPSDLPNCIWDSTTDQELFTSVEHHGSWAGHDYATNRGQMIVYGIGL
jgi:hypothetical protein